VVFFSFSLAPFYHHQPWVKKTGTMEIREEGVKTTGSRALPTMAVIGALIAGLLGPAAAGASAARITVEVRGGPLAYSLPRPPRLEPVTLTGLDQRSEGTLGLVDIRDARGTGGGWSLIVQAGDFAARDDENRVIDAAGLRVKAAPVTTVAGNAAPVGFGGTLDQPLKILEARPDTGMGRFQTEPSIALQVPADVLAGAYDATLTLTLISGQ
jgi:hypothetical protein